jgi:hypothetical protein
MRELSLQHVDPEVSKPVLDFPGEQRAGSELHPAARQDDQGTVTQFPGGPRLGGALS